jgi:hypothetical protein
MAPVEVDRVNGIGKPVAEITRYDTLETLVSHQVAAGLACLEATFLPAISGSAGLF